MVAAGCSILSAMFGIPFLRWKIRQKTAQMDADKAAALESSSQTSDKSRLQMMVSTNA